MAEEIKKDPFGLCEILENMYEFDPRLYSLQEIDAVDNAINNVIAEFREIAEDEIKNIMREYEEKLRNTDTLHIFSIFSHSVLWSTLTYLEEKYSGECEKTRSKILENMEYQSECHEASEHFEDYMNVPTPSTKDVRDEIKKNHFAHMFGAMKYTGSSTRQDTHADVSVLYADTDSVIDGRDKTTCMYDYAEDVLNGFPEIAICKANHKERNGDCTMCMEPCCSQSGVNNV